jgi:hypothetical protein
VRKVRYTKNHHEDAHNIASKTLLALLYRINLLKIDVGLSLKVGTHTFGRYAPPRHNSS